MTLYKGSISGFAFPVFADAPNKLDVRFNIPEVTPEIIAESRAKKQAPYTVLETDYKNYALVLSCSLETYLGFIPVKQQVGFVLGRQRKIDNLTELINKFSAYFDTSKFTIDNQENC